MAIDSGDTARGFRGRCGCGFGLRPFRRFGDRIDPIDFIDHGAFAGIRIHTVNPVNWVNLVHPGIRGFWGRRLYHFGLPPFRRFGDRIDPIDRIDNEVNTVSEVNKVKWDLDSGVQGAKA